MKKYLVIICCLLINNEILACVCVERSTLAKDIRKTDAIITGEILSKEIFTKEDHKITGLNMTYIKYNLKVIAIHKGRIINKILTIATSQGDCGYDFEKGKTYIIYAGYHKENSQDKFLYTGICTRTEKYSLKAFNKISQYCKQKGYR